MTLVERKFIRNIFLYIIVTNTSWIKPGNKMQNENQNFKQTDFDMNN